MQKIGFKILGKIGKETRPLEYQKVLNKQIEHVDRMRTGEFPSTLLFLQHAPTFTAGRRIKEIEPFQLKYLGDKGADVCQVQRGGEWTFHGPGQLVIYPLLDLNKLKISPKCYVKSLERAVIETCKKLAISQAETTENVGVWVGKNKIAAIGVHLQNNYTMHGVAINCNVELGWFQHIVPCGLVDKGVTSISKELGREVTPDSVIDIVTDELIQKWSLYMGYCTDEDGHDQTKESLSVVPLKNVSSEADQFWNL